MRRSKTAGALAVTRTLAVVGLMTATSAGIAAPKTEVAAHAEQSVPRPNQAVRVADGAAGLGPLEPWLAVDPSDSRRALVTAMTAGARGSVIYASDDGGRTWDRAAQSDGSDIFPSGDPMITFGLDGTAFFTTLASGMMVWRSDDEGRHWREGVTVPGGSYDRQFVRVVTGDGADQGRIYTAGKIGITVFESIASDVIAVSYSDDGGVSYQSPRLFLPPPGEQILHVVTDLMVESGGDLLLPYIGFIRRGGGEGPRDGRLTGRFSLLRLSNDAREHEGPFEMATMHTYGNARRGLSRMGLGGGRLALDSASGAMYLVWPEAVGERIQIYMATSVDGGRTWSEPQRVNDGGFDANLSNPGLAVSDGVVAVTWNDRREDPSGRCFRLFGAVSTDGGSTFGPGVPLTEGRACMDGRWANGGDTQGLAGLGAGRFLATALHDVGGERQLWVVEFAIEAEAP